MRLKAAITNLCGVVGLALAVVSGVWAAPAGPVDITSDKLDVSANSSRAVFSGDVKAVQGDVTLLADTLTVDYLAQGKAAKGHGIENLVAEGNVKIVRDAGPEGREEATGSRAVYTPAQNKIVLTGLRVVLTRGPSMLEGDRLEYDMVSGNAHVTNSKGPVKARFVPDKAAPQK